MINLELYRIFYEVAEKKNLTKASKSLNISQPAVTKHIKNLEEELGTPLFIRTKKGMILNEYGEKIFLKVKHALSLLEDAEKEMNDYNINHKGTIKIGISTTLARKFLLKYIESFHKLYPNIIFNIYTDPTKDLIKELKIGSIDFIIGKIPKHLDYDLNYKILNKTKYVFVGNPKYFNINKKIDAKDLEKYPILLQKTPANSRESAEEYFKKNNLHIEPKMNIASSNLLIDFILMGYGIGYVTHLYIEKELKEKKVQIINIEPDTETIDYGIISLKNNVQTSHCTKFIDYIQNTKKVENN